MSAVREQLRAKLKARLELIHAGNQVTIQTTGKIHTFATHLGNDVIPWRIGDVLPEDMPCCGFADQDAAASFENASHGEQAHGLVVEIVGFVSDEYDHVALATNALLDILAAIGMDPEFDGLASAYATLTGTEIEIHPDGRGVAAAIVRIRIDYFSPLWEV